MQTATKHMATVKGVVYFGSYLDWKIWGPIAKPICPQALENAMANAAPVARFVVWIRQGHIIGYQLFAQAFAMTVAA